MALAAEKSRVIPLAGARRPKRSATQRRASWLAGAVQDDRARPLPILANVTLALRSAPELREAFSYDELQMQVIIDRELPLADGAEPRAAAAPPRPFSDAEASYGFRAINSGAGDSFSRFC